MDRSRLVLKGIEMLEEQDPDAKAENRSGALKLMIDELSDIDPNVLDRSGQLLLAEQPIFKVLLDHRKKDADPKAKGFGEMLAVYVATANLEEIRTHMGLLFRNTVKLCAAAKAEGKRSFKGLTYEAAKSLPDKVPEAENEVPAYPTP